MFTLNRTLVVLISLDKNLKVSGLLVGEELPWQVESVLSAFHISTVATVEKMQRHMHTAQVVQNFDENAVCFLNENSSCPLF